MRAPNKELERVKKELQEKEFSRQKKVKLKAIAEAEAANKALNLPTPPHNVDNPDKSVFANSETSALASRAASTTPQKRQHQEAIDALKATNPEMFGENARTSPPPTAKAAAMSASSSATTPATKAAAAIPAALRNTKAEPLAEVMTSLDRLSAILASPDSSNNIGIVTETINALADKLLKQRSSEPEARTITEGVLEAAELIESLANNKAFRASHDQGDQLREAIERLRDSVLSFNDRSHARSHSSPTKHRGFEPLASSYDYSSQTRTTWSFEDRIYDNLPSSNHSDQANSDSYGKIWMELHREIQKRPEAQLHWETKEFLNQKGVKFNEARAANKISSLAERAVAESLPHINPLRDDLFKTIKDRDGRISYKVTRPPENGPIFMPSLDENNRQVMKDGKPVFSILHYEKSQLVPEKSFIVPDTPGCRSTVCAEDQDFCKAKHSIRFIDNNHSHNPELMQYKNQMVAKLEKHTKGDPERYQTLSVGHRSPSHSRYPFTK